MPQSASARCHSFSPRPPQVRSGVRDGASAPPPRPLRAQPHKEASLAARGSQRPGASQFPWKPYVRSGSALASSYMGSGQT